MSSLSCSITTTFWRVTRLAEIASVVINTDDVDVIYTDEDKVDEIGRPYEPHFKPDWDPDLLLAYPYLGHITAIRRDAMRRIGGFRPEFDGSQDFDVMLRATEVARRVMHIPKVLYHWRVVAGSAAGDPQPNPGPMRQVERRSKLRLSGAGSTPPLNRHSSAATTSGAASMALPPSGIIPSGTRPSACDFLNCYGCLRVMRGDWLGLNGNTEWDSAGQLFAIGKRPHVAFTWAISNLGRHGYASVSQDHQMTAAVLVVCELGLALMSEWSAMCLFILSRSQIGAGRWRWQELEDL